MKPVCLLAALLLGLPLPARTILAIGAHAGDMELTCGALLARHARMGDRVVLLHLSLGERGKPGTAPADYAAQKKREAEAAARALGAEVIFAPWRDGGVPSSDEAARWVANLIRQIQPSTVLTHWKNSIHKDHEAAHRLAVNAVLFAAIEGATTVRGLYFAENWEDAQGFQPYLFLAVEEQDEAAWKKAAMAYEFTHAAFSGFDYIRYYTGLRLVRGAQARKPHAVAFDVDDLSKRQILNTLP
jgi:LmbE family N-acetylglucosaminyl deacetylase